jgi:hypothetical protein
MFLRALQHCAFPARTRGDSLTGNIGWSRKSFDVEVFPRAPPSPGVRVGSDVHEERRGGGGGSRPECQAYRTAGAPTRPNIPVQELAGHANLTTTLRYMHLTPAAKDAAMRLLDHRPTGEAERGHQAAPAGS